MYMCNVLYSITKTTIKSRQITLININALQTDDKIELFFFFYIINNNLSQQTAAKQSYLNSSCVLFACPNHIKIYIYFCNCL